MSKKIIVTEKPSVAQTFANVLKVFGRNDGYIENEEWIITWCVGHLVSLAYPEVYDPKYANWNEEDLPFIPSHYKYGIIPSVQKQFKTIKNLYNRPDIERIYYAGDPAREGIYIQALVRQCAGHNPSADEKVIWIDSQTEEEILNGIKNAKPFSSYKNLINAGYERAIEDYLTGINLSRILSCKYSYIANKYAATQKYHTISVGRVMTCVLGMVVSREREIENFKSTPFYKINNTINDFVAEWKVTPSSRLFESTKLYNDSGFKSEQDALDFIDSLQATAYIEKIEKKTEKKNAPLLFNLAELQSECSSKFKISPDKSLEIAQSLYEKKLTTYPRTDARVLSSAIAKELKKNLAGIKSQYPKCASFAEHILNNNLYDNIANTRYTDDKKVTDHYAIIPTGTGFDSIDELSEIEKNVYELIVKRFLSIFYPPAEYLSTVVTEDVDNEKFYARSKCLIKPGYFTVIGIPDTDIDSSAFDNLEEGKNYPTSFSIKKGETTPPKRYTSGSIILAMENAGQLIEDEELRTQIKGSGIGTSATRGETLKKLISKEYLKLNSKTQIITPDVLGNIVYEIVNDSVPELLNPEMTASWEKGLQGIAEGKISSSDYRTNLENYVRKEVNSIKQKNSTEELLKKLEPFKSNNMFISEKLPIPCPICGSSIKTTKNGCICEKYKKDATEEELINKIACKFGIGKIGEKVLSKKTLIQLISEGKCDIIKNFTSKEGKKFDAALQLVYADENSYKKCIIKYLFQESEETNLQCPHCDNKLIKTRFNFSCKCGYKLQRIIANKEISDADIEKLLNGKSTTTIKGFKKKDDSTFNAKLILDENGKIKFKPQKKFSSK